MNERKSADLIDWKATYRELDNAALLALLREQSAEGKRELELLAAAGANQEQFAEKLPVWLEQATTLHERGVDLSKAVGTFQQAIDAGPTFKGKNERAQRNMLTYVVEVETRPKRILNEEAPRRELLASLEDFLRDGQSVASPN